MDGGNNQIPFGMRELHKALVETRGLVLVGQMPLPT